MKTIPSNEWFRLPWLGSDVFVGLKQAGVRYDKKLGFRFTSETDNIRALIILKDALQEEVQLSKSCFICGTALVSNVAGDSRTICDACASSDEVYSLYTMRFAERMEGQ